MEAKPVVEPYTLLGFPVVVTDDAALLEGIVFGPPLITTRPAS